MFIYKPGESADAIFDYKGGELISLGGSFSDAVFDKNALMRIKVTEFTEFNTSNETCHVSGKTLTE